MVAEQPKKSEMTVFKTNKIKPVMTASAVRRLNNIVEEAMQQPKLRAAVTIYIGLRLEGSNHLMAEMNIKMKTDGKKPRTKAATGNCFGGTSPFGSFDSLCMTHGYLLEQSANPE